MRPLDNIPQEWSDVSGNGSTSQIIDRFIRGVSELFHQTTMREGDETDDEEKIARADLLIERLGMDLDKVKRAQDLQWPGTQMES